MNKHKKKMSKKPKKKTKRTRYYKDKSVKQNVNVKNIINAGGGAGGGGSSSYPVPMPQYIQSPIPQAFQQTNTENMNMRNLLDEVKSSLKRSVYNPPPVADLLDLDTVHIGERNVSRQFDPVIKDIVPQQVYSNNVSDDVSELSEPEQKPNPEPEITIPFGTNTKEASGNLSEFIQDIEQNPEYLEEAPEEKVIPIKNPFMTPKQEDPNKSLAEQVRDTTSVTSSEVNRILHPDDQSRDDLSSIQMLPKFTPKTTKVIKQSRAKKEYNEPYESGEGNNKRLLTRSNFTGKILDITDWPMWDKNTFIRIDPNNPAYHLNTKSGVYGKGRKNVEKFQKPKTVVGKSPDKIKVNFVKPQDEEQVITSKRASR